MEGGEQMRVIIVKSDAIPERHTCILTNGKEYMCTQEDYTPITELLNDRGEINFILINQCAFLDNGDWEVVKSFEI